MFDKKRFIKFLIIGGSGVIVNFFWYFPFKDRILINPYSIINYLFGNIVFLNILNINLDVMWFIGIFISASWNYVWNELWTFKGKVF